MSATNSCNIAPPAPDSDEFNCNDVVAVSYQPCVYVCINLPVLLVCTLLKGRGSMSSGPQNSYERGSDTVASSSVGSESSRGTAARTPACTAPSASSSRGRSPGMGTGALAGSHGEVASSPSSAAGRIQWRDRRSPSEAATSATVLAPHR